MLITSVDTWRVMVPCRPGILERSGRWYEPGLDFDGVPKWIIRVNTDSDHTGVGESLGDSPFESIELGAKALLGSDPRTLPLGHLPLPPEADYSTFEMAILDLVGKAYDTPAYNLLGGARVPSVPVAFWAARHDPDVTAGIAAAAQARGFNHIKLKARFSGPIAYEAEPYTIERDDPVFETVAAVKQACGADFGITIDANFCFHSGARAAPLLTDLSKFDSLLIEDPFRWRGHLEQYAALQSKTSVPLAMHVFSANDILYAYRQDAARNFNIYAPMGGFVRLAWLVDAAGGSCWHASGIDLGIRDISYVHAAMAGGCRLKSDIIGHLLREDDLVQEDIVISDGHIRPPSGPGLGVTLDEGALARHVLAGQAFT